VDKLLARQSSVIAMPQALQFMSEKAIRHRLASGQWQRLHRSVFVTHNGPLLAVQRQWAAVLAVRLGGGVTRAKTPSGGTRGDATRTDALGGDARWGAVIGGLTALNLRGLEATTIHLLVPAARRARSVPPGVIVHRTKTLNPDEIVQDSQPPRTGPARSLVDAAQWARTDAEARVIIAAGFQQRLVGEDDVRRVLDRLTHARRRRLIEETVNDVVGGSESLAEIDFVRLCRTNALPEPTRQVIRYDAHGRRRYIDALFQEWRVQVEVDGGHHLEVRQAWADMRRQNALWIAGERVLRFPSWAIREDPAEVVAQLRAALVAAGWPDGQ